MAEDIYEDSVFGQVLPLGWDNDTISGIVILVDGEEEFIVEHDETGESMVAHVDRWVTAEGLITESDDEFRIKVRGYTLDDSLDYDTDDDW